MVVNDADLWVPRAIDGEKEKDKIPNYAYPDYFTLKVYHGGCFSQGTYVAGKVDFYDNVDKDKMSLVEVDNMVNQLNPAYKEQRIDYWYRCGDEDDELMKLETDQDVMIMCTAVPHFRLLILYLDHMELKRVFGEDDEDMFVFDDFFFSQKCSSGVVIEELPDEPRKTPSVVIKEIPDKPIRGNSKGVVIKEVDPDHVPTQASTACSLHPKEKGKEYIPISNHQSSGRDMSSGGGPSSGVGQSYVGGQSSGLGVSSGVDNDSSGLQDVDIDYLDAMQSFGGFGGNEEEGGSEDEFSDEDGSEDDDYDPCVDDEEYAEYGDDDDNDAWMEDVMHEKTTQGTVNKGLGQRTERQRVEEEVREFVDNEDMFGYEDSDDERMGFTINSDGELEDGGLEFNPKVDMKNPVFKLKQKFATVQVLRDALRELAIKGGWEYVFIKNDKTRLRVVCKEDNCPFFLFASKMQHESTLMIKSYEPTHKCTRKFNNNMVKLRFLTATFKDHIVVNEDVKPESLAKTMSASIRAWVSKSMAYRAKRAALLEVEGSIKEQYARLGDYGRELQRVDPATTIDIKCGFPEGRKRHVFKRMYICLGALKSGFKAGCKSVIGLDGAHLKGPFGGQLLIDVGVDANNTSWVVAWAMVELETKDAWIWFLELLVKDLCIEHEGRGWVFISDKQKGLIPAFEEVVPRAHIRFCVRHMWTNFTKLFPGKVMKDQMWACAKATTLPYFQKEMDRMRSLDDDAYKWMTAPKRPAIHWCRAFFNTDVNCDIMINNICESFNGWILEARGKPPVTMFEELRVKLMKRIAARKEKIEAYHGNICPKPRAVIEKNKEKAAVDCIATFNGGDIAEVENIEGSKNVVNLALRTCTCRRWDLTEIPCKHTISAIYMKREDPDDYVAPCYLKKTYMSIYSNLIQPVNSMDLWFRGEDTPILPPQYSRQLGRPKTKRIKDASENVTNGSVKLERVQRSLRCSNCKQVGHNVKTCKRHLPPKEEKAATMNKKRKHNEETGTSQNQSKKANKQSFTKNELRQKAKEGAEYQRMAALKSSRLEENRSAPKPSRAKQATSAKQSSRAVPAASTPPSSRPVQAASAPSGSRPVQPSKASRKQDATATRSSQRIRQNSGKGN